MRGIKARKLRIELKEYSYRNNLSEKDYKELYKKTKILIKQKKIIIE